MFVCEQCGQQSKPRQKQLSKVVEVRYVTYTDTYRDKNKRLKTVRTANKPQIVKALRVCGACATGEQD